MSTESVSEKIEQVTEGGLFLEDLVAHVYNDRGMLWKLSNKQIDGTDVYMIIHGDRPARINVSEVIAIAKAICAVTGALCPIINNIP